MGVFSKNILFCNNEIYDKVKAMINSLLYFFEKVTWPAGFYLIFFFFFFQLKMLLIELDNLALVWAGKFIRTDKFIIQIKSSGKFITKDLFCNRNLFEKVFCKMPYFSCSYFSEYLTEWFKCLRCLFMIKFIVKTMQHGYVFSKLYFQQQSTGDLWEFKVTLNCCQAQKMLRLSIIFTSYISDVACLRSIYGFENLQGRKYSGYLSLNP